MKVWIALFACTFGSTVAFGDVSIRFTDPVRAGAFAAGSGSRIEMRVDDHAPVEGLFLAVRVQKFEASAQWMLLADDARQVTLVDEKDLTISEGPDSVQKLVHPIDQEGGTCAAFAMYHMTMQLEQIGQIKLGLNEDGRMKLLGYYLSEYYLDGSRRESIEKILDSQGKKHGFRCDTHRFDDSTQALVFVQERLAEGKPLLVEFDVGSTWLSHRTRRRTIATPPLPRTIPAYGSRARLDSATGGGHAILLATGFADRGHPDGRGARLGLGAAADLGSRAVPPRPRTHGSGAHSRV